MDYRVTGNKITSPQKNREKSYAERVQQWQHDNVLANNTKAGYRRDMETCKKKGIKYGLLAFLCCVAAVATAKIDTLLFGGLLVTSGIIGTIAGFNVDMYRDYKRKIRMIERAQGK